MEPLKLERPNGGEHVVGMAIHFHMAPDFDHPAIRADQNGRAKNALEGLAVHGFFSPYAVGLQHFMLFIR